MSTAYSPAVCTGIDKRVTTGDADEAKVFTSYVERQHLTMGMPRSTRLTSGFTKKSSTWRAPCTCAIGTTTWPGRTRH